ncbi:hypothetical protein EDC56_1106 [Sinobacterium caligoides]|uniref:Uncharacterized protein n=1 Tax=Sinobacterium caligoides TaxID=933926 RepID=A0A3N2E1N1_9GAMM|nr:hypothetical protein [Sinobacterium caligoides]ROS05569.1 hypothetical protein EDC56_1106 [Sinobacterium caligoides]
MSSKILIANNSGQNLHITVTHDIRRITESSDSSSSKTSGNVSVAVPSGTTVGGGFSHESSSSSSAKYDWSAFINSGEAFCKDQSFVTFDVTLDSSKQYYLTVRSDSADTPIAYLINVPIDANKLGVELDHNVSTNFITSNPFPRGHVLASGNSIQLRHIKSNKFIGNPKRSRSWPCANISDAAGEHEIIGSGAIKNNALVRIRCKNETTAGADCRGYNNMYSSSIGWAYYDKNDGETSESKQLWRIEKKSVVSNSRGDDIYSGDIVQFANTYYPNSSLYLDKDNWLACDSGADADNDDFEVIITS